MTATAVTAATAAATSLHELSARLAIKSERLRSLAMLRYGLNDASLSYNQHEIKAQILDDLNVVGDATDKVRKHLKVIQDYLRQEKKLLSLMEEKQDEIRVQQSRVKNLSHLVDIALAEEYLPDFHQQQQLRLQHPPYYEPVMLAAATPVPDRTRNRNAPVLDHLRTPIMSIQRGGTDAAAMVIAGGPISSTVKTPSLLCSTARKPPNGGYIAASSYQQQIQWQQQQQQQQLQNRQQQQQRRRQQQQQQQQQQHQQQTNAITSTMIHDIGNNRRQPIPQSKFNASYPQNVDYPLPAPSPSRGVSRDALYDNEQEQYDGRQTHGQDRPMLGVDRFLAIIPVTDSEFSSVPKYSKGRLTLEKLHEIAQKIEFLLEEKYALLSKPMKTLTSDQLDKVTNYHDQNSAETKGKHFLMESDLKKCGLKLDSTAKTAITVLRHLGRMKEVHGTGPGGKIFIFPAEYLLFSEGAGII